MSYLQYLQRMDYLIHLIKQERTGHAKELAQKLGISRSTLFRYLDELRDYGALIKFSTRKKTFYFEEDFDFISCLLKIFMK